MLGSHISDTALFECTICHTRVLRCARQGYDEASCVGPDQQLLAHSSAERMRAAFRAVLPDIPPQQRSAAILGFYRRLALTLDDVDCRGTYSIEEALGAASLYRVWLTSR